MTDAVCPFDTVGQISWVYGDSQDSSNMNTSLAVLESGPFILNYKIAKHTNCKINNDQCSPLKL